MSQDNRKPRPPHRRNREAAIEAEQYIKQRNVPQLFESLTVGLLHHRPSRPLDFLLDALAHCREEGGGRLDQAFWDTFLPRREAGGLGGGKAVLPAIGAQGGEHKGDAERKAPPIKKFSLQRQEPVTAQSNNTHQESSVKQQAENDEEAEGGEEEDDYIRQRSENATQAHYTNPKVLSVICGSLRDLPPMPTSTVRIFLSSTFSDFKAERNILPERAFPVLQEVCESLGLDFQVVDMRWGVTAEMMNDHQVSALCLQEINTCRQVSCGPNFVALLGNRYGYRPFPASIPAAEFRVLRDLAEQMDKVDLMHGFSLNDWFIIDENACPQEYVLQPIQSLLPHYTNENDEELRKKDVGTWNDVHDALRDTLRQCAQRAVEEGTLPEGSDVKYTISVTEEEITEGLLCAEDAHQRALCYVRQLEGLEDTKTTHKTSRFIDSYADRLDNDAQELLNHLKLKKIPPKLSSEGVYQKYTVPWKGELLEEAMDEELQTYLDRFCTDFISDMKNLIMKQVSENVKQDDDGLYLEVLHHAKFAEKKIEVFCGRESALTQIQTYLCGIREQNEPLFVHGESGFGKTSLMAKVASLIPTWKSEECIVISRFLGTSPHSSDILLLLRSVMSQLCAIFGYTLPPEDKLQKMGDVRLYLNHILTLVGEKHAERDVVFILDSVDQLSSSNGAHQMSWLPAVLPPNIHILLSMIPQQFNCLSHARKRVSSDQQYIELEPLSDDTGDSIIDTYLKLHNRTVTAPQKQLIKDVFKNNRQPLFLKLVMDSARRWTSYTDMDTVKVISSVESGINTLFEEMEARYGSVFVSHALGYLTCGMGGGLSGIELEDVLSCDDDVLNEVYKYHDPPLEGIVRIPSLLWSRLQHELKDYIAERQVDGKTVMTWYHRQFWEVAEKKYLADPNIKAIRHCALAELYNQDTGIKRTVTLAQRKGKVIENADRKVKPQRLSRNNLRKLNALPYHLFHGQLIEELKQQCLLSFRFLLTKLRALGVNQVFNEYAVFFKDKNVSSHKDVALLMDFLEKVYATLNFDPKLLPLYIREILTPYGADHPAIAQICKDANKWSQETAEPLFMPKSKLNLTTLSSPLKFSLMVGYDGCLAKNEKLMAFNWLEKVAKRAKLKVFDLETKDVLVTLPIRKNSPLAFTNDSEHFFYAEEHQLQMRQAETGDFVALWTIDDSFDTLHVRQIVASNNGKYLAVSAKAGKPKDAEPQKWRTSSQLVLIDLTQPDVPIAKNSYFAKKQIDKVMFLDNDQKLVTLAKERITLYSVPGLEEIKVYKNSGMYGTYTCCHEPTQTILFPVEIKKGVHFSLYNYQTHQTKHGPTVHLEEPGEDTAQPFGLEMSPNLDKIIMGSRTNDTNIKRSFLWLWESDAKETWKDYEKIPLGEGIWKLPSCFLMMPDWSYCFVGWYSGDLSVVDLGKRKEIFCLRAHGQMVNQMYFYENNEQLISVAEDHGINTWDVNKFIQSAQDEMENPPPVVEESIELDMNEQVLDLQVNDDYVITTGFLNKDSPKFWHIETGLKDKEKTAGYDKVYTEAVLRLDVEYNKRYHATLDIINKHWMLYSRKRRNAMALFTFNVLDVMLLAAQWIPDSFHLLTLPDCLNFSQNVRVLVQSDGQLELRDFPELNIVQSIEIPKMTTDIPNIDTSSGKKRLQLSKIAVTTDGRYAFFINPSMTTMPDNSKEKYFDLIDLAAGKFVKRHYLPKHVPWKFMEDSFYYYVEGENILPGLFNPSNLPSKLLEKLSYQCLVFTEKSILSEDLSLGVELLKGNNLRIWDTRHVEKLQKLEGHIAEITCGTFSRDKCLLATGSYDFTTRLWSVESGEQLCLFHSVGSIDALAFTPSCSELVIHHYSAPQRKRASIMGLHNVKSYIKAAQAARH